ncbi:hypothetical protein HWV62_38993 [Athelia sp. TMB]|nr:hypothetical protein HWV62_38993 [Athelia sp. TMB]
MPTCLIIGGSRGLGLALAQSLHGRNYRVYATVRSTPAPGTFPTEVTVIDGIDLNEEDAGKKIVSGLPENVKLDLVIFNAGLIKKETFNKPDFAGQIDMYKTVAIAPLFVAHHLHKMFAEPSKFAIITSEGGSITLRTKEEGGGMFGHHGSKAAANMVGKLLAIEFENEKKAITVAMIHVGCVPCTVTGDS